MRSLWRVLLLAAAALLCAAADGADDRLTPPPGEPVVTVLQPLDAAGPASVSPTAAEDTAFEGSSAMPDGGSGPGAMAVPFPTAPLLAAPSSTDLPQACPVGQQLCPNAGACKDTQNDAGYCGAGCIRCGCGEAPMC